MIFCLEDDSSIRELILYTLRASNFETMGFPNAAAFWEGMRGDKPEMILLDIMLPDEDGISVLRKLRGSIVTRDIPVIMTTAKGTEYDKVIGLDLGADDYLAKPFGMMELISRIRAVLRRTAGKCDPEFIRCGVLELNVSSHRVWVAGKEIELTLKEYELLNLFLHKPGQVLSREQMLTTVWGGGYAGETRTVDVHIGTLRTKLREAGEYIKTVRGVGYRLEAQQ